MTTWTDLTNAAGSYSYSPDKTNSYTYAMSYDNLHNITAKNQTNTIVQGSGTPVTQGKTTYSLAYAYAASQPHAPSHIGTQTYTYDLDGNQNGWTDDGNGQRRSIVWDEENRIQSISDNGNEQDYKYDDAGQRVSKRSPKEETDYVNQYFTTRSNGQISTKHVFIGTERIASKLVKSNAYEKDSFYFHSDHLSSTNYVTDANGKLYEHLEYFPSGESWIEEKSNSQQNPGFNTAYQFSGKELDEETQLYYYGARYYDARTAVWQSPDPALPDNLAKLPEKNTAAVRGPDEESSAVSMASAEPDAPVAAPTFLNAYNYADANPLTKTDLDGRAAQSGTIAANAIKFALAQQGKPYVWGSYGPNSFDCSGLVYAAFRNAGYNFKFRPTTRELIKMGVPVQKSELQPGDLVFPHPFKPGGHVQIYIGNGKIVEAPRAGKPVRVTNMWGFWQARRLVPPAQGASQAGSTQRRGTTRARAEHTQSHQLSVPDLGKLLGEELSPSDQLPMPDIQRMLEMGPEVTPPQ